MGFYLFADQCVSWLPPLVFTAMNEAGVSERLGLSSIVIFFALGLLAYWKMGSYDDCMTKANRLVSMPPVALMAITEDDCDASAAHQTLDNASTKDEGDKLEKAEP